jgi:putative redox protein
LRLIDQEATTQMECTVKWAGEAKFIAETGSGHAVIMEGAGDLGGKNQAPRPMEMVLLGTGGCTAYDVVLILKRGRHAIEGCEVKLTAERAEVDPKVFTKIHYHYTVTGRNLKPETVERAIKLSAEKYCSASIMLEKMAEITHDFSIIGLGTEAA